MSWTTLEHQCSGVQQENRSSSQNSKSERILEETLDQSSTLAMMRMNSKMVTISRHHSSHLCQSLLPTSSRLPSITTITTFSKKIRQFSNSKMSLNSQQLHLQTWLIFLMTFHLNNPLRTTKPRKTMRTTWFLNLEISTLTLIALVNKIKTSPQTTSVRWILA